MAFTRSDDGEQSTLFLSGSLDGTSVREFAALTDALVAEGRRHVVLDMAELTNIETPGVAAVVALYKHTRELGGEVRIAGIDGQPLAIFKLLRFDKVFDL
ncbi:STAS domain-containing protein [Nannocystis sp. RBIL2]|uniref:STAS domain-containing protein n=1 Tax=Nannocystis sp. RBIL2 TaxID=2996788 RepID=UPI00227138E0|nr:STAS domain-containing protein [Nannocystis sp. RBIL2]MCY1071079.1 STAS domain-containing protein [Nannocystis sp. RBIL2]